MIKHGKVHPLKAHGRPNSHIEPIKDFVTKGIADAREKITIQPLACDVKGAKRFNGQQCVIARALTRTYHPQAVAIGRSLAFAVFDGLAVRFMVSKSAREMVQEFDQRGRSRSAPVSLLPISPTSSWRLGRGLPPRIGPAGKPGAAKRRLKKIGVRAIGGGITA